MGYLCTCARAHRASVSQERLGRLSSNFCVWVGGHYRVLSTSPGWGASARAHVRTPFPYLKNRLTDCSKIGCLAWDSIVMWFAKVRGGVTAQCTHARASPVSLSRKPLSPASGAAPKKNRLFSFALTRSSLNMASYWLIYFIRSALPYQNPVCTPALRSKSLILAVDTCIFVAHIGQYTGNKYFYIVEVINACRFMNTEISFTAPSKRLSCSEACSRQWHAHTGAHRKHGPPPPLPLPLPRPPPARLPPAWGTRWGRG